MTMMSRPLNRPTPILPVTQMVTHAIVAPLATHWRKATCAEVGCLQHHHGWALNTAGLSAGQVTLAKASGRRYRVEQDAAGADILIFEPGQSCFKASEHRIRLEREEIFVQRPGDWRGNPAAGSKPLIFSGADSWLDSLGTALDKIRE